MSRVFDVKQVKHTKTPADFDIPFQEIRFQTKGNCSLYGWWIPQQVNATQNQTLILVHGWKRNVGRMMPYIGPLYKAGFNLLVYDARNHGSSDRDKVASMPNFTEDILSALDFLHSISGFETVKPGLVGLSMGGAASIYAASIDNRISKVVTVGAFARPDDVMNLELKQRYIPFIPFGWMVLEFAQYRIGLRFKTFAPVNNIAQVKVPVLLIHGKKDKTAPFAQAEMLLAASNKETTQLWAIEDKAHSDCHLENGYWEKLIEFVSKA